nr:MAG TPA: hypothetical protein [Caudoviricetes sp.]
MRGFILQKKNISKVSSLVQQDSHHLKKKFKKLAKLVVFWV